ncbi:helix-turn-helix domain-containing protein [Streptomyces sp. NPDC091377]|uniref:helix-turn-helix domain-containing protein n=1 Tax=Streptomyces sp. NPDC091377 TaxID=3365995 RepID=UPI00380C5F2A
MRGGQTSVIGQAIRKARKKQNWTQKQLADKLNDLRGYTHGGCGANDIYRWETGRRSPRDWLPCLVTVLGLDLGVLGRGLAEGPQQTEADSVDRREFMGASIGAAVPLGSAHWDGRRVGKSDVSSLRQGLVDLRRLDDFTGGAATYPLSVQAARRTERVLDRSVYTPDIGRQILDVLAETHQFTSWTAFDAGKLPEARRLAQRASAAANQAGNRTLAASALSELSYLTASGDDPGEAVEMARASLTMAPAQVMPAVRVVLADRLAWACARTGSPKGVERAVGLSEDLHDQRDARTDEEPDWVYWINRDESKIMEGRCWAELREHNRAVPVLENIDVPYDESHAREVALFQCWLSESYLDAGEIDQAATSAKHAVDLVKGTDSPRTDVWVSGVLRRLSDHRTVPVVRELLEHAAPPAPRA